MMQTQSRLNVCLRQTQGLRGLVGIALVASCVDNRADSLGDGVDSFRNRVYPFRGKRQE